MLTRKPTNLENNSLNSLKVVCTEEFLPFKEKTFDLVVSNCNLHWVNDLPGAFRQIRDVLKDDGLFLGAIFGEGTLLELRNSLLMAEMERDGGVSPHISPFTRISDIGNLLDTAGFSLTTIDQETYKIEYENPFILMHDLRCMAESNADRNRKNYTSRDTLFAASAIYQTLYGDPVTRRVPATFQVIYMIGWVPHESQPKPKRRGSATVSFKDIDEIFKQHQDK
eukprot:TRINITY_DN3905_c0_g2_i1.p1 TRINITY_DN3905_c0_g2~~TRINITY_DN3905_c0_g2_i1.p1  ORF type:complete len:224 (-),score=45.40 TRINITY_DN3905_c0_g2_i1:167-838(-)